MTNIHRGSRTELAEVLERLGYRTLILTEMATGEWCERAGSDPLAVRLVKWAAMAGRMPLVEAVELLLEGGTLTTRAYSWRLV